jgi:REP element-mobilizing transposase RayT
MGDGSIEVGFMSRKQRDFFESGVYHLVMRGHNRSYIYEKSKDKLYFLSKLSESAHKFGVVVLYYVLMDNHYHLLVRMDEGSISNFMHSLNYLYAIYYNKKYGRSGTVYGGRYKDYYVNSTRYFLKLVLYIAYNPVKAGIVEDTSDYPWSGHFEILSRKRLGVLEKSELYSLLGVNINDGKSGYKELFQMNRAFDIKKHQSAQALHDFYQKGEIEEFLKAIELWVDSEDGYSRLIKGDVSHHCSELRKYCILKGLKEGYDKAVISEGLNVSVRRVNQIQAESMD